MLFKADSRPRTQQSIGKRKPSGGKINGVLNIQTAAEPVNVKKSRPSTQEKQASYKTQPQKELILSERSFSDYGLFELPLLESVPANSRVELFKVKLKACHKSYDFRDQKSDLDEKEWKRKTLLELIDFVNSNKVVYQENIMIDIMAMVSKNIFRTLGGIGSKHKTPTLDPDEEEPNLEESWPHLQIVYELFLRYVISNDMDTRLAKKHLEPNFISNMLELFNSDDPRERDYLKTILHRIYGKFMNLRTFVRKAIMNVFYKIIFEYEEHKGVAELLEILCAIVSGFALPLKEEHKHFFEKGLIPLHKALSLSNFHPQLTNCLNQFLEKDPTLAELKGH